MSCKEEFIEIYKEKVTRKGADALLDYLTNKSDFFTSPASARYHGAYEGGLCEHSLNVYHCLVDYLSRERANELYGLEYSEETVALVALLHDVCKAGCYKKTFRNVKGEDGKWAQVPSYQFDDPCPTATEKRASTWSTAISGSPGRRPSPSGTTWAFPAARTRTRWARYSRSTPWPSPCRWQTWRLPIFWRGRRKPLS